MGDTDGSVYMNLPLAPAAQDYKYKICLHDGTKNETFCKKGSFGVVYKAFCKEGNLYAAKEIFKLPLQGKNKQIPESESFPDTKDLKHSNIIKIFHTDETSIKKYIIMEFCNDTLYTYLDSSDFQPSHIPAILQQASDGIKYLHENGIAHRDLKPDNVMIKKVALLPWVKVTDFSYAKDFRAQAMTTVRGNCHWMAPEMLDERGYYATNIETVYTCCVDIYSLGLVFTFTCTGKEGRDWIHKNYCKFINC